MDRYLKYYSPFVFALKGAKMALESKFKQDLIDEIQRRFPGAIVLKMDANHIQGIPDNFIVWENRWAAFEAKRSAISSRRPNQEYYVKLLDSMSFSAFVYPENKEWFINELQQTFRYTRAARLPLR